MENDEGDIPADEEYSTKSKKRKIKSTYNASKLYNDRINGDAELIRPSNSPVIPSAVLYDSQTWKKYYKELKLHQKQVRIDLEWTDLSSRFQQVVIVYKQLKNKNYNFEGDRYKAIIKLLKESVPSFSENANSETMRWKRVFDLILSLVEEADKQEIPLEVCHNRLRDLNMTINYLQSVDKIEFEEFKNNFLKKCSEKKGDRMIFYFILFLFLTYINCHFNFRIVLIKFIIFLS